ncbi:hypothetical protein BKA82DRAFT_4018985 [Pisolithus tinctorius]|nr:hypothetical protein BKA82DRAFT_4018985 [Pisolithus tinctorius]
MALQPCVFHRRRGVDEAERESFPFAAVGSASSPLDNTIDCEEYEDDHRTKKYLECQHLHLHHNTRPDDTAVDLESQFGEAVVQLPPPTSPIEEVVIKPDDIIIAPMGLVGSGKTTISRRIVHWLNLIVLDASSRTFKVLKELCGKDDCKNVTFVTTMWDEVSEEDGSEREQILEWGFARFKKGTKRPSYRTTRITVTLSNDPTATEPTGTGISDSGICSVEGYWSALAQLIPALRAAVGAPELVDIHYLKDAIAPCLSIALSMETMPGTHHALFQVLETATLLINALFDHEKEATLLPDINALVSELAREMNHVLKIVQDLAQRTPEERRVLQSTDVRITSSCANPIRLLHEVLASASSIKYDVRGVDDGLGALKRGLEIEHSLGKQDVVGGLRSGGLALSRTTVLSALGEIPQVSLEYFQYATLPPLSGQIDIAKIQASLQGDPKVWAQFSGRWAGFEKDPKRPGLSEDGVFKPLWKVFDVVVREAGKVTNIPPTLRFASRPITTRLDGYLLLVDKKSVGAQGDNKNDAKNSDPDTWYDIAVSFEFKRSLNFITVSGHVVDSVAVRYSQQEPEHVIYFFCALAFANDHELGWDRSIQRGTIGNTVGSWL